MKRIVFIIVCLTVFYNLKAQELSFYSQDFETAFRNAVGLSETATITQETTDTVFVLNLEGYGLTDIRDVVYFSNLTDLNLSYNAIRNIAPVRHLKHLEKLDIQSNFLETVDALSTSESLEMLVNVAGNYIKNFYSLVNSWSCQFSIIGANFQLPTSYSSLFYTDYDFAEAKAIANYNITTINLYSQFFVSSSNTQDTIVANSLDNQVKGSFAEGIIYALVDSIVIDSTYFIPPSVIKMEEDSIVFIPQLPDSMHILSAEAFHSEVSHSNDSISVKFSENILQDTLKVGFGVRIAEGIERLKGYTYYILIDKTLTALHALPAGSWEINLYPNPTDTEFVLSISNQNREAYSIAIYDTQGQKIEERTTSANSTTFNISNYPKGVYFVRVFSESGKSMTEKLIKK